MIFNHKHLPVTSVQYFACCILILVSASCKKEIKENEAGHSGIIYFTAGLNDKVSKVEATSDGGFIYCGSTIKSGKSLDAFLLKVDANGHKEWYRTYGGPLDDLFSHVIQTSDGGYIAVGTADSINKSSNDSSFKRLDYVVKLNSNGDENWSKSYIIGRPFPVELHRVLESPDKFLYITGSAYVNAFTGFNTILMKLDHVGNLVFLREFTTFSNYPPKLIKDSWTEIGITVTMAQNGSVLIGGIMNPSSKDNYNYNTFLLSANPSGVVNFYYPYYDYIRGFDYLRNSEFKYPEVKVLSVSDGYLIGTTFELPGSKMVFQLIKTDLSGAIVWEKKYPGLGNTLMSDLQLLPDGSLLMTGSSTPNLMSFSLPELFDNLKSALVILDRDGNIQWSSYIGSDNNATVAHSIQSTKDGGWKVAAHTCLSETGYDKMCWMKLDKFGKLITN